MEFVIKLCGVWLGVLARMTIPFWRKLLNSSVSVSPLALDLALTPF